MHSFVRALTLFFALLGYVVCLESSGAAPAKSGLTPGSIRPEAGVTEKQLADLLPRLAKRLGVTRVVSLQMTKPTAPVTRLRALIATARVALSAEEIETYRDELPEEMPLDSAQIPLWGRPYLAAAVAHGWVRADTAFGPKQTATWKFLEGLLGRMVANPDERREDGVDKWERGERHTQGSEKYSGLIVDLGEFKVERSMSPRIVDEDGEVVYPDSKHLPDLDFVQERGILTYEKSIEAAKRAGRRPLIVRAIGVSGANRTDIVVSRETADQIHEANRAGRFLWKWAVSVFSSGR